jgi:peroxiredoxin
MNLSITQIFKIQILRLLLVLAFISFSIPSNGQLIIGENAPEIKLPDSLGKWTKLSEVNANIVLVDFWAAWCPPCIVMAQELKKLKEEFKNESFEIFALSLDRDYWKWVKMVRKLNLPFIHVNDAYGLRSPRCVTYGVRSIPGKFLIKEGKLIAINPSIDEIKKILSEQ